MMKTVAKGGTPQVPGIGPIPGAGYGGKKKAPQPKKGSRSGNPAKRAAEDAARAQGVTPASGGGTGFGLAGRGGPKAPPSPEELAALQKMLGR
jgi:signal recognition particle subunit SRP54